MNYHSNRRVDSQPIHSNLSGRTSDSTGLDTPHFGHLTCALGPLPSTILRE